MKINKDRTKERLDGVPESERVFIYDAGLIIKFLSETFMPPAAFLPEGYKVPKSLQIEDRGFLERGKKDSMPISHLYEVYQLWREQKDYTRDVETKYIFSLIVKRLRFYRNGWEFNIFRRGTAQIWHAGPLVFRKDVSPAERERYSVPKKEPTVDERVVEANPLEDLEGDRFVEAEGFFNPDDMPRFVSDDLEQARFTEVE